MVSITCPAAAVTTPVPRLTMQPVSAAAEPSAAARAARPELDASLLRVARFTAPTIAELLRSLAGEAAAALATERVSLWRFGSAEEAVSTRLVAVWSRHADGTLTEGSRPGDRKAASSNGDEPGALPLPDPTPPLAAVLVDARLVASTPSSYEKDERRDGRHPGDPATVLAVADAGIWRRGCLVGCLRAERLGDHFDAAEAAYIAALADRVALSWEEADRRRAEEALLDRERKLDEVEQLTNLGSWEWELATDTITWSTEQLRIHGVDGDIRTQDFATFLDRVHPDDRQRVIDECERTIATGIPFSLPYRIVRRDGTEREMEAVGKLLPGMNGGSARLVGISQDVTDRNAAERALRASEESYRTIFQNVSDGIWVHDLQTGDVVDINLAAAMMFGYTREEMLAAPHDQLIYPGTEYTPERVAEYMGRAAAGETPRFEWLGRHRDGGEVWAELTLRRVTIAGEDRILASARDIGERKAAERALQRVNEELEQRVADRTHELADSNAALAIEVQEHQEAQNQLARRTHELEAVFAALPDLYFRLGNDGTILDHRSGLGTAPYLPAAQFLGRRMQEVLPEPVAGQFAAAIEEVTRAGQLVRIDYELPAGDEAHSFEARLLPSADGSIVTIVRDITDRVASQEALRRSEEHFRAIIENGSDHVMIVDATGAITYVGPSVERILGYRPEEMIGLRPDDLVHPDDIQRVYGVLQEIVRNPGTVRTVEYRIRHRNGSWRVFENFGRTLRENSAEGGIVANGRDITERKQVEDELVRQKVYFEQILDSIDAGIAVFDRETRFEYATPSSITDPVLRRWSIGRTVTDYGRARGLPEETIRQRQEHLEAALASKTSAHFEQEIRYADGSTRQMLRRLIPILDEEGEVVRIVGYSVDITDRKAAEVALEHAKEEAERANRAKSEFLSRMSHELRTPLNGILGFAQVLERNGLRPEQQKYVGHILKGGRHLLRLINEILELSRIEAGRMSLSLEPIRIADAMREALDLVRPLAEQARIELELVPISDSDAYVHADRQRLVQVLLNLLSNAIKYNRPGGRVRFSCERTDEDSNEGYSILVEDTGRGIPSDRLDQLFTPFARLGAEQTETEGTGLGLALSQRLAEAMGGTLLLQRTSVEGSVFRLDLRCAANPLVGVRVADGGTPAEAEQNRAPASILYIEDNLTNLSLVETFLESKPYLRTISALRGQTGVELAREKLPDLVLLDLHLPDIRGEEVLRQLKADPRTAGIPVVVISADATGAVMQRLRASGAAEYLTKPIDLDEFLRAVERYLPDR